MTNGLSQMVDERGGSNTNRGNFEAFFDSVYGNAAAEDADFDAAFSNMYDTSAQPAPRQRVSSYEEAIARAQQPGQGEGGFWSGVGEAISEGAKGAGRAVKEGVGGLVVNTVSGLTRLAGTPVRALTGWEGLHKLANAIDESYANFGAQALESEYGANPDGFGYGAGRFSEKLTGIAGNLGGLAAPGGIAKAGAAALPANAAKVAKVADAAARGIAKIPGARTTAAAVQKSFPFMFGNNAAVQAYDTARENGKSKAEATALAGLNGAIHFLGFKAFESQSLNKMLGMPKSMEAMMPKWANEARATGAPKTFTELARSVRNGMIKHTLAERGRGMLKAGGIMALQDMLSDVPMQVAEGGSWDNIDFNRVGKKGLEGLEEGALMEGAMGAAAMLRSNKSARNFLADKIYRNGYDVVSPSGKVYHEPGLLQTPQQRMALMKQNPDATERVLDIIEHGGVARPDELDAAFLPPDMSEKEQRKFAADWRKDLEPYVEQAWNADQSRGAGNEYFADREMSEANDAEGERRLLTAGEEKFQRQKNENDEQEAWNARMLANEERKAKAGQDEYEQMMLEHEEARARQQPEEESRSGGEQPPPEQETPKQETPDETGNVRDEAPAQPEQGQVERPEPAAPVREEPRPVEGEPPRAEAPREGVVEPRGEETAAEPPKTPQEPPKPAEVGETAPEPEKPVEAVSAAPAEPPAPAERPAAEETPAPREETPVAEPEEKTAPAPTNRLKRADGTDPLAEKGQSKMKFSFRDSVSMLESEAEQYLQTGQRSRINNMHQMWREWIEPLSDKALKDLSDKIKSGKYFKGKDNKYVIDAIEEETRRLAEERFGKSAAPVPEETAPTNRLKRRDGTDPLAEKEAEAEKAEVKPGAMTAKQKAFRLNAMQKILGSIDPDVTINPDALRRSQNNPNGFVLKDLKKLDDPANDGWQYELGLSKERADELRAAVKTAYLEALVGNASGGGSKRAGKALYYLRTRPDDLTALAKGQANLNYAYEKAQNEGKTENAIAIADYLRSVNERINALDAKAQGKVLAIIRDEMSKLSKMESKNRVSTVGEDGEDVMDVVVNTADVRRGGKEASDLNRGLMDVEAARTDDEIVEKEDPGAALAERFLGMLGATTSKDAKLSATSNGKEITFTWEGHINRRTGKSETISVTKKPQEVLDALWPRDENGDKIIRLSKADKENLEWAKNTIDELVAGHERDVRSSKGEPETQAERDRRYALDADYQKYLKDHGWNDAEPIRERYEREGAKLAAERGKLLLRDANMELNLDREYDPNVDGDGRTIEDPDSGRVVGTFNRETNKLKLFRGATIKTLVHELGGHATLKYAEQLAERGDSRLLDRINRVIDEAETAAPEWVESIRKRYKQGKDESDAAYKARLRDEVWAALRERNSPEMEKAIKTLQGKAWYNRAWAAFRDAWKGLLSRMGMNRADLSKIDKMSNEEFLDFLDKTMAEGKTLGKLEKGGAEGTRNAIDGPTVASRLGKIKDWFRNGGADNYAFINHPADWSMHDSTQIEFDRLSKESRLAEAVGALDNPQDFWKVFLPTAGLKDSRLDVKTSKGSVVLVKDVDAAVNGNKFGYSTARSVANGKYANAGAKHMLPHIAECGYVNTKSVLTVKEINDNFARCMDSPIRYDDKGRAYHEVDIGHGVKMRVGVDFIRLNGKMEEVPVTMKAIGRNDWQSKGICQAVAKKMSEKKSVPISTESGAATSSQTMSSLPNSAAERKGGGEENSSVQREARAPRPAGSRILDDVRSKWEKFKEKFLDRLAPAQSVQDEIGGVEEIVGKDGYTDHRRSTDYVAAADKANGREEALTRNLQKKVDQVENDISQAALKGQETAELLADFDLYAQCKHAAERNRTIAERNGVEYDADYYYGMGKVERGGEKVGLSENVANEIVRELREKYGDKFSHFEDAQKKLVEINREDIRNRVASGRLSARDANQYLYRWQDYVPLKTDMAKLEPDGFNSSTASMRRNEFMKARGRGNADIADSPFAASVLQAEQGIRGSVKNELLNVAANLVEHAADKGNAIGEIVRGETLPKGAGWTFTLSDGTKVTAGGSMRLAENRPDVLLFKRNGELMAIRIDKGANGRGLALSKAISGENIGRWGSGTEWIPRMTHWMSAMRTQYSPEFIVSNLLADHLEAYQALVGRYGIKGGTKTFAKMVASEISNFKALRNYLKTGMMTRDVGEAVRAGLLTKGGVASEGFEGKEQSIRSHIEEFRRKQKKWQEMSAADWAKSGWSNIRDFISFANEMAEYSTRMGIFSALKKQGVSVKDAVKFARDATVNFNRKGTAMPLINGLYMFANASVQGTVRSVQAMRDEHGKELVGLLVGIGVAKAVLDNVLGDDEEREKSGGRSARNLSDYDRKHNVGVPIPGTDMQFAPLRFRGPYAAVPYIAQMAANVALGNQTPEQGAVKLVKELGDQVTDIVGGNGVVNDKGEIDGSLLMQSIAPSVADPIIQLASGKDYKGDERRAKEFDKTTPASSNGKRNTPFVYKKIAQGINAIPILSGGNENRKGRLDFAPEDIQLIVEFLGAGPVRDIGNAISTGQNVVELAKGGSPERTLSQVPFVRRVVKEYPENTTRYYNAIDSYERDKAEFNRTTDLKRRAEFGRAHPQVRPMVVDGKVQSKSRVDALNDRVKELMHLERGEIKNGRKWVERKTPITEAQKKSYHDRRLELQAKVLDILGA